jgi:SAM-dependent methyltransferase
MSTPNKELFCPVCGQVTKQDFLYSKNGCAVMRCQECSIGRAETSGFDPSAYYTQAYFSGEYADGYADYEGAETVLRKEFAHLVKFIRGQKPEGRLLDLGCAFGFFLQEAKSYFDVAGIEISEQAAAFAQANGLNVIHGAVDEPSMAKLGAFDIITMLDVIEHLPDPHAAIELCKRHLRPGGIIVITTGDFGSGLAKLTGAGWRLMTPPQHLWFLTKKSFSRIAISLGLTVANFSHPWKFVPLNLIIFQLKRILGLKRDINLSNRLGLYVNLFDAMRVVLQWPDL